MKPWLWIAAAAVLAGGLAYGIVSLLGGREPGAPAHSVIGDEIVWLEQQFELTEEESHEVRRLHREHLPVCEALCLKVIEARARVDRLMAGASGADPEVREAMRHLHQVETECREALLDHVLEVAAVLGPERRKAYLEWIQPRIFSSHGDPSYHGDTVSP